MTIGTEALETTDNELLMQFVRHRDETAFRQLVERHGPLVMTVCRQLSRDHHDAEDAFQATLLLLARRAHGLLSVTSLAGWLHRVAYRTALRVLKRRCRSGESLAAALDPPVDACEPLERIHQMEIQQILHEELQTLPDRYRSAICLCDLEGRTRAEAADHLDSTESAVKAALARGRRQLRLRLLRRGVAMSLVMGAANAAVAAESVPATLLAATVGQCVSNNTSAEALHDGTAAALSSPGDLMMSLTASSRTAAIVALATVFCVIPLLLLAQIPVNAEKSETTTVSGKLVSEQSKPAVVSEVGTERPAENAAATPPPSDLNTQTSWFTPAAGGKSYSLDAGSFVLVNVRSDYRNFLAYNKQEGEWQSLKFAEGVTAIPVISGGGFPMRSTPNAAGFSIRKGPVTELAAVDTRGRFCVHKLERPIEAPVQVVVDGGLVYHIAEGVVYAFSAETGTWGAMSAPHLQELKQVEGSGIAQPSAMQVSDGTMLIEFADRIAAFSVESGKWSTGKFDAR